MIKNPSCGEKTGDPCTVLKSHHGNSGIRSELFLLDKTLSLSRGSGNIGQAGNTIRPTLMNMI